MFLFSLTLKHLEEKNLESVQFFVEGCFRAKFKTIGVLKVLKFLKKTAVEKRLLRTVSVPSRIHFLPETSAGIIRCLHGDKIFASVSVCKEQLHEKIRESETGEQSCFILIFMGVVYAQHDG